MKKRCREWYKSYKAYNSDKGMSIVTVIIALGFVSILVSILMITTAINFKMKNANVLSKDSFYSAEQVLDELQIGLEELVSDGLSRAYAEVLANYDSENMTAADKNELVKGSFYNYLWEKLAVDPVSHKTYIAMHNNVQDPSAPEADKGLYQFLEESTRWHNPEAMGKEGDSYGAFLRGSSGSSPTGDYYTGELKTYQNEGIVLKGVEIYYKDPTGFVSMIKTDIKLRYPGFVFSDNDIPDVPDYAFITDTALVGENKGVTRDGAPKLTITGNTYAYRTDLVGFNVTYNSRDSEKSSATQIVTADYRIANGSVAADSETTLWAGDILAKSSDVSLLGQSMIKDDINITGRNGSLTIGGYYTGYGASIEDAGDSSGILINGVNTTVDLSGIKRLTLSGRGFVATSEKDRDTDGKGTGDIFTGESIAIKGNQLMYMVPAECIGVNKDSNTTIYGKNPISGEEYERMLKDTTVTEVAVGRPISRLGMGSGNTIADYVATKDGGYDIEKVFLQNSGKPMVYYYMHFKSEAKANEYFAKYYSVNKDSFDRYIAPYLKSLTVPSDAETATRLEMAGLMVQGSTGEGGYTLREGFVAEQEPHISYGKQEENHTTTLLALSSKLSEDYEGLKAEGNIMRDSVDDDSKALFLNLIDEDIMAQMVDGASTMYFDDNGHNMVEIIYNSRAKGKAEGYDFATDIPVEVNTSCNLVIANCSVSVPGDFTGTIIAKGRIVVDGQLTMKADPRKVQKCLALTNDSYKVSDIFKDTDKYQVEGYTGNTEGSIASGALVEFERWMKN